MDGTSGRAPFRPLLAVAALLGAAAAGVGALRLVGDVRSVAPPSEPRGAPVPTRAAPPAPPSVRGEELHLALTSVSDADALGTDWVVLDRRATRIHRLSGDGRLLDSFGRPGRGPGELRDPAGIAVVGDTVFVPERVGGRLHRFDPSGAFLGRRDVTLPGCFVPLVLDAGGTRAGPALLVRCVSPGAEPGSTEMVALLAGDGPTRVLWRSEPEGPRPGERTLFSEPLLATAPEAVAVGRRNRRCVELHPVSSPGRTGRRCLPERRPVRLDPEERAFLRERAARIAAGSPIRIRVPRSHAAVYRIFLDGEALVGLLPGPDDAPVLVGVGGDGESWTSPVWGDGPAHVSGAAILETREELHGTRVRVRTVSAP